MGFFFPQQQFNPFGGMQRQFSPFGSRPAFPNFGGFGGFGQNPFLQGGGFPQQVGLDRNQAIGNQLQQGVSPGFMFNRQGSTQIPQFGVGPPQASQPGQGGQFRQATPTPFQRPANPSTQVPTPGAGPPQAGTPTPFQRPANPSTQTPTPGTGPPISSTGFQGPVGRDQAPPQASTGFQGPQRGGQPALAIGGGGPGFPTPFQGFPIPPGGGFPQQSPFGFQQQQNPFMGLMQMLMGGQQRSPFGGFGGGYGGYGQQQQMNPLMMFLQGLI